MKTAIVLLLGLLTSPTFAGAPLPQCQAPAVCPNYAAGIGALPSTGGTITGNLSVTGTLGVTGASTLTSAAIGTTDLVTDPTNHRVGILTATPDKTLDVQGAGSFKIATSTFGVGGVIGSVSYTQVTDTTTKTAGLGSYTVFSTITIPSGALAKNGDAIDLTCAGTMAGIVEARTQLIKIGSVVISSRTISVGTANAAQPLLSTVRLVRVSAGNQIRLIMATLNTAIGASTSAAPSIGNGTNTIDESQPMVFTCSADGITAGSSSFLYSNAVYIPGQ